MGRKRGKLSIMESIVLAVKECAELKTHIAYKSKLDSRTIERYVPLLLELHLIKRNTSNKYEITSKGLQFLEHYRNLKKYDIM